MSSAEDSGHDPAGQPQQPKKSKWSAVGTAVKIGVRTTLAATSKRNAADDDFLTNLMGGLESFGGSRQQFEYEFESRSQVWIDRKATREAAMRARHQEQFHHLRTRLKGLELEASITSAPVTALRRKQQSLLASKHYAEAFDHMKVRGA
jgi:hypothetical protein